MDRLGHPQEEPIQAQGVAEGEKVTRWAIERPPADRLIRALQCETIEETQRHEEVEVEQLEPQTPGARQGLPDQPNPSPSCC